MSKEQWESLCDGCGICCLCKFQENDKIHFTNLICKHYNHKTKRCKLYNIRDKSDANCIRLTPKIIKKISWLPETCAYRRVLLKKPLPDWHHLISNDRTLVHKQPFSLHNRVISELKVLPHLFRKHIIDWIKVD